MSSPSLSLLVPTLDAGRYLDRLLPALAGQSYSGLIEYRALDSTSSDDTVARLEAAGWAVTSIPRSEFRHGPARNQLAEGASGEVLVFLSQDAVPEGPDFLTNLVAPFQDKRVGGVSARVLPHPDSDPMTARTVLAAPEAGAESAIRELAPGAKLEDLEDRERAEWLRFNNVASALRTSVHREVPFPDVPFGEDFAWAADALRAGWKVGFVAEAVARHAHRYSATQAFERYRVDAAFHRRVHGLRVRPSLLSVIKGIAFELREDWRFAREERTGLGHLWRAPLLRGGQVLGQWFGSRGWNLPFGRSATRRWT
jgi:rhamnosyltransferase